MPKAFAGTVWAGGADHNWFKSEAFGGDVGFGFAAADPTEDFY